MDKVKEAKYLSQTFKQAAEEFIKVSESTCRPSTLKQYKGYLLKHIYSYFEKTILSEVTEQKVEKYKNQKIAEGVAIKTINNQIGLIVKIISVYNEQFKIKKLENHNKARNINIISESEIKKLLKTAKLYYPDFYPLVLTAVNTGISRGELIALTWQDIDWKRRTISINKSVFEGKIIDHKINQ